MITREDVESYLDRLGSEGATYEEVEQGLWLVKPSSSYDFDVVISYNPPVLLLRVKVMPLPPEGELAALSRRLLELNATDLLHGAYGIADEAVVLTEALELEHLDFEEFLAAFESMTLSLTAHIKELGNFGEAR